MGAREKHFMKPEERKKLEKKAASRGIGAQSKTGGYSRHVLLCAQSGCCKDKDEAKATRKTLNKACKKLRDEGVEVYVTEVECLRFCQNGPLMVVYPEGDWYGRVTPEACERIAGEHLRDGEPVEDWVFARNPLKHDES